MKMLEILTKQIMRKKRPFKLALFFDEFVKLMRDDKVDETMQFLYY